MRITSEVPPTCFSLASHSRPSLSLSLSPPHCKSTSSLFALRRSILLLLHPPLSAASRRSSFPLLSLSFSLVFNPLYTDMHLYPPLSPSSRPLLAFPPPSVGSLLTPYYFPSLHHDSTVSVPSLLHSPPPLSRFGAPSFSPRPLCLFRLYAICIRVTYASHLRPSSALRRACLSSPCIFPPANSIQSTPEFVSSSLCTRFPDSSCS